MKYIIDLIEDIRTEIGHNGEYTITAMLLKEDSNDQEKLIYAGEAPIASFDIDPTAKRLLFKIKQDNPALLVDELVKHLLILDMDAMMYPLHISVNHQYQEVEVIGFGKSIEDSKYILFIKI